MFWFRKPVEVTGVSSIEECLEGISDITAPRFAFAKDERKKLLRGKLSNEGGVLRWPLNEYRFVSPRSLHFTLRATGSGTQLTGEFRLWLAYRVIVVSWLVIGCLFDMEQIIVAGLIYRGGWSVIRPNVIYIAVGVLLAYGYTLLIIWLGRGRERDLVRALRNVMAGPVQAGVVKDLLIR